MRLQIAMASILAAACVSSLASAQNAPIKFANQGVGDDEIVIGTHLDLTGPVKTTGASFMNGMKLALEEINEAGGINGRKLRLVIEDNGYDPKRAVIAATKLISQDKVFAFVGALGAQTTAATAPIALEVGIFHLFPATAAESAYMIDPQQPQDRLKFSAITPYPESTRRTLKEVARLEKTRKYCSLTQNDDFGKQIKMGFEQFLQDIGAKSVLDLEFKRGTNDFTGQAIQLKTEGCELIVLGTSIRETTSVMQAAQKNDWRPVFVASIATNSADVIAIGGDAVEGLYATGDTPPLYPDKVEGKIKEWVERYHKMFDSYPDSKAALGYRAVMNFAEAARLAGKNLTGAALLQSLESGKGYIDLFSGGETKFSATNHLSRIPLQLQRIKNGRWEEIKASIP